MMLWLAVVDAALAYTVKQTEDGEPLRWRQWPVTWTWSGSGPAHVADALGDVRAAFETWDAITQTPIAFEAAPGDGAPTEAPDAVNWVWVSEDWPFDPELLALTSSWTEEDGTLIAFDIRINGTKPWASDGRPDAFDFRAAVVHEVGHVLGLDHTDVYEAAMYTTAGMGEPWRAELVSDDEEGARFLYPPVAAEPERRGWACGATPGGGGWGLPLAALVLGRRVSRRARSLRTSAG